MKKDTTLSVLIEIRDILKGQSKTEPAPETWLITVPKGMTVEKALEECKKNFDVYCWYDNFKGMTNDREPTEEYTAKFKANIEADEELKNLSANELKEKGIKGITLLERLLLELDYFKRTGGHLDVDKVTLCSGSRRSGGRVPRVHWNAGHRKLYVHWYCLSNSDSRLRARAVVS